MTALQKLLDTYRNASVTEREKGTYFEELILTYLRNEATYRDLYSDVWTYADWADEQDLDRRDTGIDLVAKTQGTDEFHAIQCKFFSEDHRVQKSEIDSFFTASGKKPFTHRIIVSTTNHWSEHAEYALQGQQPPVSKIDLHDLENSQIDWSRYQPDKPPVFKEKKQLRNHQKGAVSNVLTGLKDADRGKLIMACGTGKTFTSLKIAEKQAGKGKRVLFLVPSLALLSQTLTEWTQESDTPLHSFAVCSDSDVGKKRKKNDDLVQTFMHELRYPATTDAKRLAMEMEKRHDAHHMSVVFSTYHSIEVISRAQHKFKLADFDLIICDEAHRTTGATFEGEDESAFVKVHDAKFLRATKRTYMTATPRIYGDLAKATAERESVTLCSMDDESMYGKELYVITFSQAVKQDLLVDYKVIVLSIDEAHVSKRLQKLLSDENNSVKVDDAGKIIGCWKALAKYSKEGEFDIDSDPMQRAVAFCQVIEIAKGAKTHKVSSKQIASIFQQVVEAYQDEEEVEPEARLVCNAEHVDGSMNASEKEEKIEWLKAAPAARSCKILSNVRCLSEGVDVPALDAVLFLTPRNSQVDVVQSVGRVMRKAPGKKRGYVILPVVIPAGMEPHEALNDNKTYKVVWQVLQALRSHDDRFDDMINRLDLVGADKSKMEVIAVTDHLPRRSSNQQGKSGDVSPRGNYSIGSPAPKQPDAQQDLQFQIGEIERAIYAKIVKKCGNRQHWEDWANDIAKIARTHIARINGIIENPKNKKERAAFDAFAEELRDDLNDSITDDEIVEMLAQHIVTKPVFDALFSDYNFTEHNPMSVAMQGVLDALQEHNLDKEADTLQHFYERVQERARKIDDVAAKQRIIKELYDNFFNNAFPKVSQRLGIVYTPIEVVDFIIHSTNELLQKEFDQTLGSEGVHILDPFTGTGTFITRMLQSGLIPTDQLKKKYRGEIHANEIILLAYYLAAINIEAVYHGLVGGEYEPFGGICLTDTFQLYEKEDLIDQILVKNSERRKRQKKLDIRVIMGNPPYSAGQDSANDNNANIQYPTLDTSIRDTYAARSTATLKNALYDSYIRAIKWASGRIGNSGVIGFVTNAGYLEANTADGMRKCLADEFSSIYVFHLRGNQRTSGERSRKEGGKIFGSGSRAPIAISFLVKNPEAKQHGQIYFHDIGDYLTRDEKLERISALASIEGITAAKGWRKIVPDDYGDWLNQRDRHFGSYWIIGDKKSTNGEVIFDLHSRGIETSRDAWCYNYSRRSLSSNMQATIDYYNKERIRYHSIVHKGSGASPVRPEDIIEYDLRRISWGAALKEDLLKNRERVFEPGSVRKAIYRPFTRVWMYFNRHQNNRVYQMPRIFPDDDTPNRAICIVGLGTAKEFSTLMVDRLADVQVLANDQCFPMHFFLDPNSDDGGLNSQKPLFSERDSSAQSYSRRDGISDMARKKYVSYYCDNSIVKEDIFYYVYGLLHSPDYRERYADNLTKELPRIPCVKKVKDFWAFSKAGRALADLHVGYESVELHPVTLDTGKSKRKLEDFEDADFYVKKMKFAKRGDKSAVIYNSHITIRDIPLDAYEYVVNGKPALEWVMERQGVKTDRKSGIVNDANDWAIETMGNAKYPLELFQRVITVSLETMKIVRGLPGLEI